MKMKYIIVFAALLIAFVCGVYAYMPQEGAFAYVEVQNYTLHDINFTVPAHFNLTDSDDDRLVFENAKHTLKITTKHKGKIKKVNATAKVKANRTMLGSQKGYLVEKNRKYTFSYREGDYLVTIKSDDLALMIGVMGKD